MTGGEFLIIKLGDAEYHLLNKGKDLEKVKKVSPIAAMPDALFKQELMTLMAGLPTLDNVVISGIDIKARQSTSGSFNVRVLSQDAKGSPHEPAAIFIIFDPEHPDKKVEAMEGAKIPFTREGKKLIIKRILVWLYDYGIKEVKFAGKNSMGKDFFAEIFQEWKKLGVEVGEYTQWICSRTEPRWRLQVKLEGLSKELGKRISDPGFQGMKKG